MTVPMFTLLGHTIPHTRMKEMSDLFADPEVKEAKRRVRP